MLDDEERWPVWVSVIFAASVALLIWLAIFITAGKLFTILLLVLIALICAIVATVCSAIRWLKRKDLRP